MAMGIIIDSLDGAADFACVWDKEALYIGFSCIDDVHNAPYAPDPAKATWRQTP